MGFLKESSQKIKEMKIKKKENIKLFKNGESYGWGTSDYLGGHPDIDVNPSGIVNVGEKGLLFKATSTIHSIFIPIEHVLKAEFKTDEQISKDVTLTRLLALGVFAFGLKKKNTEITNYLIITYKDEDIENKVIFKTPNAGDLSAKLMNARKKYLKENPQSFNKQESQENKEDDPMVKIKLLVELKEQGILTEEEFQEKKKILLGKIV